MFLLLAVEGTRFRKEFVDITARQLAVMMVGIVLGHIEINRTVAFVSISGILYFLDIFDLLDYMARSVRFDGWGQHI